MASKYIDPTSIIQVIGNVFNSPRLLDYEDKYTITENDFADQFHKITFGAIYKLHELGAENIGIENILDLAFDFYEKLKYSINQEMELEFFLIKLTK